MVFLSPPEFSLAGVLIRYCYIMVEKNKEYYYENRLSNTKPNSHLYDDRLCDYVEHLLCKERVIEAKFYILSLKNIDLRSIRLGFKVAVASFDNDLVRRYNELLISSGCPRVEIVWFNLQYYIKMLDLSKSLEASEFILANRPKDIYVQTVFQACLVFSEYDFLKTLVKSGFYSRLNPSDPALKKLKEILHKTLLKKLGALHNAKLYGG